MRTIIVEESDVLVLVDCTLFGSATDGLMVTPSRIYFKDLAGSPGAIAISEVNEVGFKSSLLTPAIVINGMEVLQTGGLEKKAMAQLADVLSDFCQRVKTDANPTSDPGLLINAGWEDSTCRWFVAWKELNDTEMVGAVAGYSGGGSFEVERFYARHDGGLLESLWIDFTDRMNDEEIDFDTLAPEVLEACEQGLDCIWEWNDQDEWNDNDRVVLKEKRSEELEQEDNLLLLKQGRNQFLRQICEMAGLTAAPAAPNDDQDISNSTGQGDEEMAMSANELADKIIGEFKNDPRNKVFVNFETLLASACEETGKKIKGDNLAKVIDDYQSGDLDDKGESIYDGAVAIIGYVARNCFGDDPDEDVDYEIEWIQGDDSTYTAEVRPS